MKILVTGAKGFIGKNLIAELKNRNSHEIYECGRETSISELDEFTEACEFVYHLAGINRPEDPDEFMKGNYGFTSVLLDLLKKHNNRSRVLFSSSIQAELDNPYGISKKAGEDLILSYGEDTGAKVFIYRFPNVFGKWSKPDHNSVIATFCYNIARDRPITINNRATFLNLVYIDDVVDEMINSLEGKENRNGSYCEVEVGYKATLGEIADLLYEFKENRRTLNVPNIANKFEKLLYSTYLSYLPTDRFCYPLKMNIDHRGSFTEIIKTNDRGQFSVNVIKPNITKGNHWHHTKNEKFLVVSGKGMIRFRNLFSTEIIEYMVSGDKMEVVDIPTGYTHSIVNIGDTDLITFMWANEPYDPDKPDTYPLEV